MVDVRFKINKNIQEEILNKQVQNIRNKPEIVLSKILHQIGIGLFGLTALTVILGIIFSSYINNSGFTVIIGTVSFLIIIVAIVLIYVSFNIDDKAKDKYLEVYNYPITNMVDSGNTLIFKRKIKWVRIKQNGDHYDKVNKLRYIEYIIETNKIEKILINERDNLILIYGNHIRNIYTNENKQKILDTIKVDNTEPIEIVNCLVGLYDFKKYIYSIGNSLGLNIKIPN